MTKTKGARMRARGFAVVASLAVWGVSPGAWADTTAGGPISASVAWTAAAGPYHVSSDVTIQGGATLTIEAGSVVYMGAGTKLTVAAGSLQVLGTRQSPILVSSEQVGSGAAGAPAQWNQWIFTSGAVNSRVEHATIEYGSGLAVTGAAVVLNHVRLRRHEGAAISADLAASLTGVANSALDNGLNAVTVPAGTISGSPAWGLRGIPFVVQGTVSVGTPPRIDSVSPVVVEQGEATNVTLSGVRLTGLTAVTLSRQGLGTQVQSGGTATQVTLAVTPAPDAQLGAADLQAKVDAGKVSKTAALTVIRPQPKLTSLSPATIYTGQGPVSVDLNGRNFNPQGRVLVNDVESTHTYVSPTQLTWTFPNQTGAANLPIKVQIPDPDNAGTYFTSAPLTLAVVTPPFAVTPATQNVDRGASGNLTVTMPYPAPAGGLAVNLSSSAPSRATVPATVTIAEATTAASFPVNAIADGIATISASASGFITGQAQVVVVPPPTFTLSPASVSVGSGRNTILTIQSNRTAGAGGQAIEVSSSDAAVVGVPSAATIASGATSTTVVATGGSLGTATVTAQASGFVSGSAAVTSRAVALYLPSAVTVTPGASLAVLLSLSDPAPAGGLSVTFTSSDTGVFTAPTSVTVPANGTSLSFNINGIAAGSATLTASASGYASATIPVTAAFPVEWSTSRKTANVTLSNGNRTATHADTVEGDVRSNFARSTGKRYFEIGLDSVPLSFSMIAGVRLASEPLSSTTLNAYGLRSNGVVWANGVAGTDYFGDFVAADRVNVAADLTTGKIWFGKNGSWAGGANPAAGTGAHATFTPGPAFEAWGWFDNSSGSKAMTGYFGAAELQHAVPSGFLPWADSDSTDADFMNVSALLHFDGSSGATVFVDQTGKTWTAAGNAQISTTQGRFGGASAAFDGSGDSISTPHAAAWDLSVSDFTIELWARVNATGTKQILLAKRNFSGYTPFLFELGAAGNIGFYASKGSAWDVGIGGGPMSANTWYHLAATRSGDTYRFFVNGELKGTQTVSGALLVNAADAVVLGYWPYANDQYFNGYIDDLRVTRGTARYSSTFTPPAAPYPDVGSDPSWSSVASLLHFEGANGSTTFVDQKGLAWTPVGSAQISTDKTVMRGTSAKLNGSAGNVYTPAGVALGAGDWTVEFWLTLTAWSDNGYGLPVMQYGTGSEGSDGFAVEVFSSHDGSKGLWLRNAYSSIVGVGGLALNTPIHVVVVKSGSTAKIVLNGRTWSGGLAIGSMATPKRVTLGNYSGAWLQNRTVYIDDFRMTPGMARYTAPFAAPVGPYADRAP